MWSDKRYVNVIIDVLLFLVGINFLHYGQLILPVICLMLFIDRKFRFKVNNLKTFVVLCLFAIAFFAFSYGYSFYCVMGFCLPMAYYIGSNMKDINENNVAKAIYIIAFGMSVHLMLNFAYDYYVLGPGFMGRHHHYDIWTQGIVAVTTTAVNSIPIIYSIYYVIFYETDRIWKVTGMVFFLASMIYNLALGRRTPVYILIISFVFSVLYEKLVLKHKKKDLSKALKLSIVIVCVAFVTFVFAYMLNIFNLKSAIGELYIITKFKEGLLDMERLKIFIGAVKLAPYHLFGGQEISSILEIEVHDLWMDTYDFAGIVPYALLIVYSIIYLLNMAKALRSGISNGFKIFVLNISVSTGLLMFIEPVMTGSSLFLICSVMIGALIEGMLNENEGK